VVDLQTSIDRFSGDVSLAWYDFRRSEHLFLDADRILPAASLIKLPILALALREIHAGRLDPTKRLAIRIRDRAPGAGVVSLLRRGLHLTVQDMLTLMIAISDNSAANRVIDLLGVDAVNAFCREIGLERTTLVGLLQQPPDRQNEEQRAGRRNETSAADMLGLLLQLERGDLLPQAESVLAREMLFSQQRTEGIGRYLPLDPNAHEHPLRLASKSGWLAGVWHDAGLIYDATSSPLYALVVMTAGSDDRAEHVEQEGLMLIAEIARTLCLGDPSSRGRVSPSSPA
jgi:beta-lactamase class A